MSRFEQMLRSVVARVGGVETLAVLVAGVGLGVGMGAVLFPHRTAEVIPRRLVPSREAHRPAHVVPEATAGVQTDRAVPYGEGGGYGEGRIETAATVSTLLPGSESSFASLARGLPGKIELAVKPLGAGRSEVLGGDLPAHGWSTTKPPVIAALIKEREHAGLDAEEWALARSAITESSNDAIIELFHKLESATGGLVPASDAVQEVLEASGDHETRVATAPPPRGAVTTFGQSEWRPVDAVKFFAALASECLDLPASENRRVLDLMQNIVAGESWGLGEGGFAHVAFKGGWGPEPGRYLVRQSGIVEVGTSRAIAVSIVDFAPSFQAGQTALTEVAGWLREHLRLVPRVSVGCRE